MVDRIIEFLKNRYFIGAVVAIVLGVVINSFFTYSKERANEIEFERFQEVNASLATQTEEVKNSELNLEFDSLGFEMITKSVLAKKSIDEKDYLNASILFNEIYAEVIGSNISSATKEVLTEQYSENIVRIYMELDDFESGDKFITENELNSSRFHDVAGDFYKYFDKTDKSNFHYDRAISFDIDESQKNLINLKRPIK
jgi:predicted negative regulator of RcsB-dependent stress response